MSTAMSMPVTYSVRPVPSLSYGSLSTSVVTRISSSSATQVSSSAVTSSLSRTSISNAPTATATTTSSSMLTSTSSTATPFGFYQLTGGLEKAAALPIPENAVISADYHTFCPSGNCFTDCRNMTRVFQTFPDGIAGTRSAYGMADPTTSIPDVTLFGICSNLAALSQLSSSEGVDQSFASFFPASSDAALYDVSSDISQCFVGTCQSTRDPAQCIDKCSIDNIRTSNDALSINGMYPCLYQMCSLTCGLPFANQDVFGVGLLASYITQAVFVLILAGTFIISASWRLLRKHDTSKPEVSKHLDESLKTFLAAQCYFGICAVIASLFQHPSQVDPLNGYPLLSISVTGFVPTIFTMMLLHSHGVKSWYSTFLTSICWLFSTILFFMLVVNLSRAVKDPQAFDQGLDSLFNVESCGKSSAMSLCEQIFNTDPLAYLSWNYNHGTIPNINNVPVLWVLSTVVLLCLVVLQTYDAVVGRTRLRPTYATVRVGALTLGSILFALALAYQGSMIKVYTRMNVIDWSGWTFGQVVALLFWVPALLDCTRSYVKEVREERESRQPKYSKLTGKPPRLPTPHSSAQSKPDSVPAQGHAPLQHSRERNEERAEESVVELRPIARKPVATVHAAERS